MWVVKVSGRNLPKLNRDIVDKYILYHRGFRRDKGLRIEG